MASVVNVKNISLQTSEKEVKDFFSFCGKITKLELHPTGDSTQSATVTFEKETAAKTALLLDNTQLGSTQVQVSGASPSTDDSHYTSNTDRDTDEITQEDKPRSRIVAEYLAHGYVIGDKAIQQAIDLDSKHGVSNRFVNTITGLNQKYHVDDKAKSLDQSYGVTQKTNSLWSGLTSYYEKAAGTPTGQKLVNFYTQTSREVQDIHAEARRLADLKKTETGGLETVPGTDGKTTCKCGGNDSICECSGSSCACASCPKSSNEKDEKSGLTKIPNSNKTTCSCGGSTDKCPCPEGACACASCPKASNEKGAAKSMSGLKEVGGGKTKCGCGGDESDCKCSSGACVCDSCPKSSNYKDATKSDLKQVGGGKTKCGCGGDETDCKCSSGACVCDSCPKSSKTTGSSKTT